MNREIDRKVAEALGWKYFGSDNEPHYSTDIAAAIGALEEFCRTRGWTWEISRITPEDVWCDLDNANGVSVAKAEGATIPLAICNAILAASEKPKPDEATDAD